MTDCPIDPFWMAFLPFLIPILALLLVMFIYRKEALEIQKKREESEIKRAAPYENMPVVEGRKCVPTYLIPLERKHIAWYIVYLASATFGLVALFGEITYGPTLRYIVFLTATGIGSLVCYCHALVRAEKQRYRLLASGVTEREASGYFIRWIIVIPIALFVFVTILLRLANSIIGG